jgi:DNA-binding transcriptional ArsR family regulator
MSSDVDTAAAAGLIANRARCAMLDALFDGGERTAGSLAQVAGIAPSTASGHLRMLADGGLIVLEHRGRRQFARLASPEVAHALEALSTIAPTTPSQTLRASSRARALRQARTCYDHLAGALGVALTDALCASDILTGAELTLTDRGAEHLQRFGIDLPALRARRRPLTRPCLDWSERRPISPARSALLSVKNSSSEHGSPGCPNPASCASPPPANTGSHAPSGSARSPNRRLTDPAPVTSRPQP